MTFEEIKAKAIENNWSEEQLKEALNELDEKAVEYTAEELTIEEMSTIAGGTDEGACPHKHVKRRVRYEIGPGRNDWGYHVSRQYRYTCNDCGLEWQSKSDNAWKPEQ